MTEALRARVRIYALHVKGVHVMPAVVRSLSAAVPGGTT